MASFISVKNKSGEYEHYEVPQEVYVYILQLEAYIRDPERSKLLEAYPDRFSPFHWVTVAPARG